MTLKRIERVLLIRALKYLWIKIRRTPDSEHRIGRGVAAGVLVCFTPFFGLHFFLAALIAFAIRGNMYVAVAATFVGNPITFPFIGAFCLSLGNLMLGKPPAVDEGMRALWAMVPELAGNAKALLTGGAMEWSAVAEVYSGVLLPYTIGGLPLGVAGAVIGHNLSVKGIHAYKVRARARRLAKRRQGMMARSGPAALPSEKTDVLAGVKKAAVTGAKKMAMAGAKKMSSARKRQGIPGGKKRPLRGPKKLAKPETP